MFLRFNLQKAQPPIPRGTAPFSGRIMWVRCFQKKMDEVMLILKQKTSVIEHKNAQPAIKYYNGLALNFALYEMQQHKFWYDNVHPVREKLCQPVLRKHSVTNRLEINFHPSIFELIKESEAMMNLNLGNYLHFFFF